MARRRCDEAVDAEARLGSEPSVRVWTTRSLVELTEARFVEAARSTHNTPWRSRAARGEPAQLANVLGHSALAHTLAGQATDAELLAEEAVGLAGQLANTHVVKEALAYAAIAFGNSDPQRALALAREAVEQVKPGEVSAAIGIAGNLAARNGRPHDAITYYARHIEWSHWVGERGTLGVVIASVAALLAESDPEAAAVLQGVSDAFTPGFRHAPNSADVGIDRSNTIIDSELGADRAAALRAQGTAMSYADAIAYAQTAIARYLA